MLTYEYADGVHLENENGDVRDRVRVDVRECVREHFQYRDHGDDDGDDDEKYLQISASQKDTTKMFFTKKKHVF